MALHLLRVVAALMPSPRRKYGNKPVEIDGHKFPSQLEGRRYQQLKLLERAGKISGLKLQTRYPLVVNGVKVCTYISDFDYHDCETHEDVVEDAKGFATREYKIKRALMLALHGIAIVDGCA